MGLIDADGLLDSVSKRIRTKRSTMEIVKDIMPTIGSQPTAYDVDKVVERLEKEKNPLYREDGSLMGERTAIRIDKAIEIVKGGGIDAKTDF